MQINGPFRYYPNAATFNHYALLFSGFSGYRVVSSMYALIIKRKFVDTKDTKLIYLDVTKEFRIDWEQSKSWTSNICVRS